MYIGTVNLVEPGQVQPNSDQVDITDLLVHELAHGLGIFSRLYRNNTDYMGPKPILSSSGNQAKAKFEISLFDSFLHSNTSSIRDLLRPVTKASQTSPDLTKVRQNVHGLPAIKQIQKLMTEDKSIHFKTKQSTVYLHTAPFRAGSSLSHLHRDYVGTQNFLMAIKENKFVTSAEVADEAWNTAPVGSFMVEILETLGYKANLHPRRENSQLALLEAVQNNKK